QKIFGDAKYAEEIQRYNGQEAIVVGKTVYIPLYSVETPVVGETYKDIARTHYGNEVLAERLLQYNNMQPLESLEHVKLPLFFKEHHYTYHVQSSDTLAWISRWLTGDASNYRAIAEANGIDYPYRLKVGQAIKVPASLVSDPTVFDKPIPRSKRPAKKPKSTPENKVESETIKTPVPTVTPEPQPIEDPGLFDIE
ncbi:LysM peptidoglycan-binding domain-containing protein, partial [bacterium]|nr:LysM peptidoglycan-binding domain-containing protein [bacterium]